MFKLLNIMLISVSIIVSLFLVSYDIKNKDLYESLIKLCIIIILIPKILIIFKVKISLYEEFIYTIFVFFAYFLGSIINLYNKVYCYDTIMHFLSGFATSFLAIDILKRNNVKYKNIIINIIFILGFSALVAVLWEIFEFSTDIIFKKDAQNVLATGIYDTMKDIISAMLATIIFIFIYVYERLNNKNIIIKKFIEGIR